MGGLVGGRVGGWVGGWGGARLFLSLGVGWGGCSSVALWFLCFSAGGRAHGRAGRWRSIRRADSKRRRKLIAAHALLRSGVFGRTRGSEFRAGLLAPTRNEAFHASFCVG